MPLAVLYESSVGYALFDIVGAEEIGAMLPTVQVCVPVATARKEAEGGGRGRSVTLLMQLLHSSSQHSPFFRRWLFFFAPPVFFVALQESVADLARFGKLVKFKAFQPFRSAEVGQCVLGLIAATIY